MPLGRPYGGGVGARPPQIPDFGSSFNFGTTPSLPSGPEGGFGMFSPPPIQNPEGIPQYQPFNFQAMDPRFLGGAVDIKGLGSRTFPNLIPLLGQGMQHHAQMAALNLRPWEALVNQQTSLGTAGIGAMANMYGSRLGHRAAMAGHDINRLIAEAQYGQGGLAHQAHELNVQRLAQEAAQAAAQREHAAALQGSMLASQERIARMPFEQQQMLMQTPLVQQLFGLPGGGAPVNPFGGGGEPGLAEEEFNRRELAASGRRAADEAASVLGSVEAATGPGGAGMAGGPAAQAAANRARLMRLQVGARERMMERDRLAQQALAERGQSLGLIGQMFG